MAVRRSGDHLTIQPPGSGRSRDVLPASDSVFFAKGSVLRFSFQRDLKSGLVTGVDVRRPDASLDHWERSNEAPPVEKGVVTVDPAILERYVGNYQLGPGFILSVTREGARLFTQATHQARIEVFPSSQTEFFLKVTNAQLTFYLDGKARAERVVLHQHGRDLSAKRVP
jgi:hypothetical protein